jgi:hypothetical protein
MSGVMAGAAVLGAGGAGAGGSAATVTIEDKIIITSGTGSTVTARFALGQDGDGKLYKTPSGGGLMQVYGQWCDPVGDSADFEGRATVVSQTKDFVIGSDQVDQWLSLHATRIWGITDTLANGVNEEAVLLIEIRDKVTLAVRDSAEITIRARKT